jgi:hypothetical protein
MVRTTRIGFLPTTLLLTTLLLAACASAAAPSVTPSPSAGVGPVTTDDEAIAAVIAHEPRLAGIRPKDPDMIGQSSWYEVAPASGVGAFIVMVWLGWGDCPSGCIEEHSWAYAVAPDGSVTVRSESGAAVPPDAWPGQAAGGEPLTGLHVSGIAGPTCPVETVPPDPACAPRPAPNVGVLITNDDGTLRHKVVLDAAGQVFVALEPGVYVVDAEGSAGFMSGPEAHRVVVDAGRVTDVTLAFDTGIR